MRALLATLIFSLLLLFQLAAPQCTGDNEDFSVLYNSVPVFRVFSQNNTCQCPAFASTGTSRLAAVSSTTINATTLSTAVLRFGDGSAQTTAYTGAPITAANVDPAQIQLRVNASCPAGTFMTGVSATGVALCSAPRGYPGADCGTTTDCLAPLQCINYRCGTDFYHLWIDAGFPTSYGGTGSTWSDVSGNSNNCAFVNSPVYNSLAPSYMQLNGVNQNFDCGAMTAQSTDNERSFEAWIYPTTSNRSPIVDRYNHGLEYNNGGFSMWIRDPVNFNGAYTPTGAFPPNRWYHAVGVYKINAYLKIYVNGALIATTAPITSISNPYGMSNMLIGKTQHVTGVWFAGYISMVRLYRRALGDNDVFNLFNGMRSRYGV